VIDGPQSVVFDEAENRLHAQKSILAWCLGAIWTILDATSGLMAWWPREREDSLVCRSDD